MKTSIKLAILGFALSFAGSVQAAINIESGVIDNIGYELGSTLNDNKNPLQVNLDEIFGVNDWVFAQRDNNLNGTDETDIDIGFTMNGNTTIGGTWSVNSDTWDSYSNIMIVLKDGGGSTTDPDVYVGYLIEPVDVTGFYASPFENTNNGNIKNISHASVYVRTGEQIVVPEPSTYALIFAGISLAGVIGYRSRSNKN